MNKNKNRCFMRTLDIAQLYLRIAIGAMLILHNIGKWQNYEILISNYPQWEGVAGRFWFVLFSAVECIAAMMLIIGWRVRVAAATLILGTIVALSIYFPHHSMLDIEVRGIYCFIYIYIFIAGGGVYSFDYFRLSKG